MVNLRGAVWLVRVIFVDPWSEVDGQGGFFFRLGVIFVPILFGWGTLRAGFNTGARVLVFGYMGVWVASFTGEFHRQAERLQAAKAKRAQVISEHRADPPAETEPVANTEPQPRFDWRTESADGRAVLTQRYENGSCSLSCAVDGKELWSDRRSCEDHTYNAHFVANDCGRWVVFFTDPSVRTLRYQRFISVFDRTSLAWNVMGGGLLRGDPPPGLTYPIAGLASNPGAPPRYSSDGRKVEFATVENLAQSIPLFAAPRPHGR